jgi:hypothetical protein
VYSIASAVVWKEDTRIEGKSAQFADELMK